MGDWGNTSILYDEIAIFIGSRDLTTINEAQTRFDVIDRFIRDVLGWQHGQIEIEVETESGRIDYCLRSGDYTLIVEAKRIGASFPTPTTRRKLKLSGSLLRDGAIGEAIGQAEGYAISKKAQFVVVTNGVCWCLYNLRDKNKDSYAILLFPFSNSRDAEELYNLIGQEAVESASIEKITNEPPQSPENRLVDEVRDSDARIDRNNLADHISPALSGALYSGAVLSDADTLKYCFVPTEARQKFDNILGMHLADVKPINITPARRLKTGQHPDELEKIVSSSSTSYAPPLTLIIGPVGAGKSTYLKHFELVAGRELLSEQETHWIYIDFEQMGSEGEPRKFIYRALLDYLQREHPETPTDYRNLIEPAYEEEIKSLARGPYAGIYNDKEQFNRYVTEFIRSEYEEIEPYVDRLLKYLCAHNLCVIVLDNVDLYESEQLETTVFAEGLALSKRVHANVIVSIRERTFVRH